MDEIDECTNCDEGSAEYQCNTCQVSLCQTCRDRHKRKKGTSHHDVIKNSLCQVHTNKVYISCCKQCEVPVCITCMRESHFGHDQTDIDQMFESKMEEFLTVFNCLKDTFTNSTELATKIVLDEVECEDEISEIQSKIISRSKAMKDALDIIVHDNIENLTAIKRSLMSDFQTHKAILSDFISKIKYLLNKYDDVESTELPVEFIMTQKEKVDAMKKLLDIPRLSEPLMPCYEQTDFQRSDIESLLPRISYLGIACRERSPRTASTQSSLERVTTERSPERITTVQSPERVTTEQSPERVTTEQSPERVTTERTPERVTTERSPERLTTELSPERVTTERSPERVTTEQSPERVTTEQSPERVTTEQSPERVTTEQSPERVTTEQSPERVTTERSPERVTTERSPERVTTERSPERVTTELSPERVTTELSPERVTTERSPERVTTELSPERVTTERSPERVTTERSPERVTTEQSPERVTTEQSPERVTTELSPERVTTERSPERVTTERSPERVTTEQSPERVATEQSPERVTTEQSPERVTTEGLPERVTTEQSPERVTTEQSPERVTTEGSPERVTSERWPERVATERSPERVTIERSVYRVTAERFPEGMTNERLPERVTTERSPEGMTTEQSPETVTTERKPERITTDRSAEMVKIEGYPERVTTERSPERVTIERSQEKVITVQSPERLTTGLSLIPVKEALNVSDEELGKDSWGIPGMNSIYHISSRDDNKFWVSNDEGDLVLTDFSGHVYKKIKTSKGTGYHAILKTGDLIYANEKGGPLKTVGLHITPVPLINTFLEAEIKPLSVFVSSLNNSILIGTKQGNNAQVVRFNDDGEMIDQIQYKSKREPLYKCPHYITENKNGDICVSDYDSRAVVVVNSLGNHRFTYTGHPRGTLGYPFGICTDIHGRILFCDSTNYKIHLIDENGTFLSVILTQDIGKPLAICEDGNGDIWFGAQGRECIMKIINNVGF